MNKKKGTLLDISTKIQACFSTIRAKCVAYTHTKYAEAVLYGVSFVESFIFPIPPDVLLLPMVFSRPSRSYRYAFGATLASVFGGVIGYAIGLFFFASIGMWIIDMYSLHDIYEKAQDWFTKYGVYTMLVAGITPVPYKLATILAGMFSFTFPLFIIVSFIGRGIRFFVIALLPHIAQSPLGKQLQKHFILVLSVGTVFVLGLFILYSLFIKQ